MNKIEALTAKIKATAEAQKARVSAVEAKAKEAEESAEAAEKEIADFNGAPDVYAEKCMKIEHLKKYAEILKKRAEDQRNSQEYKAAVSKLTEEARAVLAENEREFIAKKRKMMLELVGEIDKAAEEETALLSLLAEEGSSAGVEMMSVMINLNNGTIRTKFGQTTKEIKKILN